MTLWAFTQPIFFRVDSICIGFRRYRFVNPHFLVLAFEAVAPAPTRLIGSVWGLVLAAKWPFCLVRPILECSYQGL